MTVRDSFSTQNTTFVTGSSGGEKPNSSNTSVLSEWLRVPSAICNGQYTSLQTDHGSEDSFGPAEALTKFRQ